jgi:hypothetical protein
MREVTRHTAGATAAAQQALPATAFGVFEALRAADTSPIKPTVSVIGFLLVSAAIVARGGYRETALAQMSVKA